MKKEIRISPEFKALESNDGKMVVEGYAIVFDSPATHGFTEIICKGALDDCDMKDVPLKYNHNESWLILARTRNKSLTLIVDDVGLKIRAELIDTSTNIDAYKSIQSGLLDKMSFAFTIPSDGEQWDYDNDTRKITKIEKLYDVSVVDTPFYDATSIYARSLDALEKGKADLEKSMRAKEMQDLKKRKLIAKIKIQKENI